MSTERIETKHHGVNPIHHRLSQALWVLAFAATNLSVAVAQGNDPLVVEIDVFSGLPNPVVELTPDEAAELMSRITSTCSQRLTVSAADVEAPGRLGYRGLTLGHRGRGPAGIVPIARMTDHRIVLTPGEALRACGANVPAGQGEMVLNDGGVEAELFVAEIAYSRGVIPAVVYQAIRDTLRKAK